MSSTRLATSPLNCTATADENTKSCFDLAVTTAKCTLAQSFSKGCECVLNCTSTTSSTSSLSSQTSSPASVLELTKDKQRRDQSLPAFGSLFGPTAFLLAFCLLLLQTPVANCMSLATNTLKSDVPASGNDHSLSTETFSHEHLKYTTLLQASIAFSQSLCGSKMSSPTFSNCLRTLIRTVQQLEAGVQQQLLTDQRYTNFLNVAGSRNLEILLRRNVGQEADEDETRGKRTKRNTFLPIVEGFGTHRTRRLIGKRHIFLEIRGKGVVGSKNASSEYAILDIRSTGEVEGISIRGKKANKYLCFNKRGKVTTKKRFKPNSCTFRQYISDGLFSHYIYNGKKAGSKCKGCYWLLSMSRRGVVRKREVLDFSEPTTMWTEREVGGSRKSDR